MYLGGNGEYEPWTLELFARCILDDPEPSEEVMSGMTLGAGAMA